VVRKENEDDLMKYRVEGKDYSLYTVQSGEGKNRSKEVEISTKAIKNQVRSSLK